MIGTNLNLDLPLLSDTLTYIVSKTATALAAIEDSIADAATPAALNITETMSFSGNAITNVSALVLANGPAYTAPGAMYYSGNEFYLVDATGTIQVTSLGQLNSAAFGGIGGDYGGANPALVSYDTATGQYRFYVNPTTPVWATLSGLNLLMNGTLGTVTFGVDPTLVGAHTFTVKTLPASGVSFLVYNATSGTVEDGGVTSVTNPLVSNAAITASTYHFTTQQQIIVPACLGVPGNTSTAAKNYGAIGSIKKWAWTNDGNTAPILFPVQVPVGAVISAYGARVNKTSGTSGHIKLKLVKIDSDTESNADSGNSSGIDYSINNPGDVTITPSSAVVVAAANGTSQYQLAAWTSGNISDTIYSVFFAYTI